MVKMKFRFNQNDKLILIDIDNYVYLLDTGSPISFTLVDSLDKVTINDKNYPLLYNPLLIEKTKKTIACLTDEHVDAVIGTDIISETSLTIDYLNQEIYFLVENIDYEDIGIYNIPLIFKLGYIYTKLYQDGKPMELILDSGAETSYVKKEFLDLNRPCGDCVDYSLLGEIKSMRFEFDDGIHEDKLVAGIMPHIYEPYCQGIISLFDLCAPGFIRFDFKNNRISFSRRFL